MPQTVGFQGLLNKWVKISRNNRDAVDTTKSSDTDWSKQFHGDKLTSEDYSTRTAETSTIDSTIYSSPVIQQESRSYSFGRRLSLKKLTNSNSYTDILRLKNEEFRKHCPEFELDVNVPFVEQQHADGSAECSVEYDTDEHLGVSIEELFNPLTSTNSEEFYKNDSMVDKQDNSIARLQPVTTACNSCSMIHEKIQDYLEFTTFLQSKDKILSCEHCRKALSVAFEAAKSMHVTADNDVDHGHPITEISCDSTLKRGTATQSTSSPVPIHDHQCDETCHNHQVEESIALMESSRRLFDFMNLHKQRIAQMTQEKNERQENLDSSLSHFTSMCQSIRQEIDTSSSGADRNNGNAMNMLLQLETQINQLKSQQSVPLRVLRNPLGTVARHDNNLLHRDQNLNACSITEEQSCHDNMYYRNNSHDNLGHFDCSTPSDVISCISESSLCGSDQDDFMFSLDDE